MPFVPVADTVEVELRQLIFGQKVENVLGFRKTGGVSIADATDLWNALLLWWTTDEAHNLSVDISLREGQITDLSSDSGFSVSFAAPTPNPNGFVDSPGLPSNVALCVSFRTPNRGRSFRGRNYVAGLGESEVTGNTVAAPTVAGIQTSYSNLISIAAGVGFEWVVISRSHNLEPRLTGVATAITSVVVTDPFVDSQRRRLTGRGQ